MATIKWDDNVVEIAENWRLGEQQEAEDALDIDLEGAKSAARMQLLLYISIRRVKDESELPRYKLADLVKDMDLTSILDSAEGDASPPGEGAVLNGSAKDLDGAEQLTTGSLPSDTTST